MPKNISVEGDLSSAGGAPFDTDMAKTVFAGGKKISLKDKTTSSVSDDLYLSLGDGGGTGGGDGGGTGGDGGGAGYYYGEPVGAAPGGIGYGPASAQIANQGSPNVFAEGQAVHRVGDTRLSGATTAGPGISTVIVN